ncbi:MAG: ion transporter [Solirubrobacterales bacterium]
MEAGVEPNPETGERVPALSHLVHSKWFEGFIFTVIILNAIVLGLETYPDIQDRYGDTLFLLNEIFLGVFIVEILLRISAYGSRPWNYFRSGWNVFDFVVVFAVFIPGVRENATLLRLVRLLRVVRVVSVLPDLRVLLSGMARAIPPIASMAALAVLLIFIYGMIGWKIFGEAIPERWGDIGEAMLTLFTVLTLEGWNEILFAGQEVTQFSWVFFVSFVLIASFLLINILIAIIINAVEEAREAERTQEAEERLQLIEEGGDVADPLQNALDRLAELKSWIGEVETEISVFRLRDGDSEATAEGSPTTEPKRLRPSGRRGRGM